MKAKRILSMLMAVIMIAAMMTPTVLAEEVTDAALIESVIPANGATGVTNVGIDGTRLIKITFGKAMDPSSLDKNSVVIKRGNTVIDYTPIINDGTVYAIDPADLAVSEAEGGKVPGSYTGALWSDYYNQSYTITLTSAAKLADGVAAVEADTAVTAFTASYFVGIAYAEGKYIDSVGEEATISVVHTSTAGSGQAPSAVLTNADAEYNNNAIYSILNNDKRTGHFATINLDQAYDVAGIMIRSRYDASAANSWAGVSFNVGNSQDSTTVMMHTGSALNNTRVLGYFAKGMYDTANGQYIYLNSSVTDGLFFPNKIWVFAYITDENAPEMPQAPVKSVIPAAGSVNVTNVGKDATKLIKIEFSEEMIPATLNKNTIVVKNGNATVDYTPLVNDGKVYVIDPADLAVKAANGDSKRAAYTGTAWDNYSNNTYTITMTNGALKADKTAAVESTALITRFTSSYIADIAYVEGRYIENVATEATIAITSSAATNQPVQTVLTNEDMVYSNSGAFSILNPDKTTGRFATITLDKAYDVAGVMVRTRYKDSTAPSWNGVTFKVGMDEANSKSMLYTGFSTGAEGFNASSVLASPAEDIFDAAYGQYVYLNAEYQQLFFPNKIWIFAYVEDGTAVSNPVLAAEPVGGATNVTNIGKDATKLIQLIFSDEMEPESLDMNSVVVTRNGEVVEYVPVINDGYTYAIDPADLAPDEAEGSRIRGAYAGMLWADYINNEYKVTLTKDALKEGGTAVAGDIGTLVTKFTSKYFVNIPYVEGRYIESVGEKASISLTTTGNTTNPPESVLTQSDMSYSNQGEYSVFNPDERENVLLGEITLDKIYDVAGVMIRTRYGASSYPRWNGTMFTVGQSQESAKPIFYTGFGDNAETALGQSSILGGFAEDFDSSVRGQKIYMHQEYNNMFFPNKIWVFAYINDDSTYTVNAPAFDYKNFDVSGSLAEGFTAEIEIDRAKAPALIAAIYNASGVLIDTKSATWDAEAKKATVTMPGNAQAAEMKVLLWDNYTGLVPQAGALTEANLAK